MKSLKIKRKKLNQYKHDMKKYPHQQFIEDNKIELDNLLKLLQKRIHGFEELESDLQHTTEHDREQLIDKLELLSHEILEDLEEQFEDQLENNDEEEEVVPEEEIEPVAESKEDEKKTEEAPFISQAETSTPIDDEAVVVTEDEPLSDDETILKTMYASRQLKVAPTQLIRNGFRTPLDKRIIRVGKYALHRGKYDTHYQLLLSEK
jgi:hypothetical protein